MAQEKTLTAPLALIKVKDPEGNLQVIGRMKNIRVTETIRRGRVVGIGNLNPSEIPPLEWSGTVNVGQYAIKLNSGILKSLARSFNTTADFVKNVLFEAGIDIHILKKIKKSDGTIDYETFAKIENAYTTSEGLDISEGQIGSRDGQFEYTEPILFPAK